MPAIPRNAQQQTLRARDIMQTHVLTVCSDMLLHEVAEQGKLIGVISQTDVVRCEREASQHIEIAPDVYVNAREEQLPRGFHLEVPDDTHVRDVMTPVVVTADEEASVEAVGQIYYLHGYVARVA